MSPQSFCSVPWNTIYISPTGDIENCCVSSNQLGKFPAKDLDEVLTSDEYIEIKSKLSQGKFPTGCNLCNHANPSLRSIVNQLLGANADNEFYHNVDNFKLEYLDVRWTNTCNSACVYCGPTWSSKWADELGIAQPVDTEKTRKLKEFFYPKLKDIKVAYLAGGEPLLSKDNEWLLETLYEQNPNCKIRINTNLTNLNTKVYQLLCKFKNKTWIVSGESIGERYEYVRYGSKWVDFEQNLKTILANKDDEVVFNTVYSAVTAVDLVDYVEWLGTMGVSPSQVSFFFYNNGAGGFFDPRLLPESTLNRCRSDLIEISTRYSCIELLQQCCKSISERLDSPLPNDCTYTRMIQTLETIDRRRGTDSKKIFPEIYDI